MQVCYHYFFKLSRVKSEKRQGRNIFLSSFTWKLLAFIDKLRQSKGKRKGILGEIKSGGLTALRDRGAPWTDSHAPVEREEGRKENKVRGRGRNKGWKTV